MDVSGRHTRSRGRGKRGKANSEAPEIQAPIIPTGEQEDTGRGRRGKKSKKRAVPVDDDVSTCCILYNMMLSYL